MGKRKTFRKSDAILSTIEHSRDATGRVVISPQAIPPAVTQVAFPRRDNARARTQLDFNRWYGIGIDPITYLCQRQVERFLESHDGDLAVATVAAFCENGLAQFLPYCSMISKEKGRNLEPSDINRDLIDGYLLHLSESKVAFNSQRGRYKNVKSILVALGRRGLIQIVERGDDATFPHNPFPSSHRRSQGENPLSAAQRKAFTKAVKTAVMPLLHEATEPTGELLSYALLVIALHTGRNTTPLLEMAFDCLRPHPKDNVRLLIVHKRRSSRTQRVPVRRVEDTSTVWTGVVRLIERVKELTGPLREEAPDYLKDRLWLYRSKKTSKSVKKGQVTALSAGALAKATKKLIASHDLRGPGGDPLRINVSILRQTFANRMFEILNGDLAATANALGSTTSVTDSHYMKYGENAERNWRFMGNAMQEELLTGQLRATEKTPAGGCTDVKNGQFAPKNGAVCMNFLDCLRCRNYVVTGDDLYRLFSFYWLIVRERSHISKRQWQRGYAHIVRLIDRDVVKKGLELKVFQQEQVDHARDRAKVDPHPFWASRGSLEAIA